METGRRAPAARSERGAAPARAEGGERERLATELERLRTERDALRERLAEAEQELAELPRLRARETELETHRASYSWRLTAPFRRAAAGGRTRLLPQARLALKRGLLRLFRWLREED